MPIKGLSERRQMPRLGRIKLGVMIQPSGGQSRPYPRATDHFVVPDAIRAAVHDKAELNVALASWCTCEFGEGPKALPIMFPADAPDAIFPQFLKMYKAAGLYCAGDGQTAKRWNDRGSLDERACPCEHLESGECGGEATLNLVLPDVPGLGVWQLTMGNQAAIVRLNTALEAFRTTFGGLRGIPFILRLEPEEVQRWDDTAKTMKRTTIHSVRLDTDLTMRQIVQWRAGAGAELRSAEVGMLLPRSEAPEEDAPARPGPAEDPWDISMCYRTAGQMGANAAQYARWFEMKYGRSTSDCLNSDVDEERALFRGLAADPERARLWISQVRALTDEQVARRRAQQRQLKLSGDV